MNKIAMLAVVIGACSHGGVSAQVLAPAESIRVQEAPAAPFSICSQIDAVSASQATICGLVQVVGKPRYTLAQVTWQDGNKSDERFLEFDAVLVEDLGKKDRPKFRCVAYRPQLREVVAKVDRYLLIGFRGSESGRLPIIPRNHVDFDRGFQAPSIAGGENSVQVLVLLPTYQTRLVGGGSFAERTFLNLAQTLVKDPPPAVVRQVTGVCARFSPTTFPFKIGALPGYQWMREVVGPRLAEVKLTDTLSEFRIGGLLASWDRPGRAVPFIRSLPKLVKALDLDAAKAKSSQMSRDQAARNKSQEVMDDLQYLCSLDLFTGVDPDAVMSILFSCQELRCFVLDPRIDKPSLEYQFKVIRMAEDPDPQVRMEALCQFAHWYNETDKLTYAPYSPVTGTVEVENEEFLRAYWRKKIGAPPNP